MEILLLLYLILCGALFIVTSILLGVEATAEVCKDDKSVTDWFTKDISKVQAIFLSVVFFPTVIMCLMTYPIFVLIFKSWNYMGKMGRRS